MYVNGLYRKVLFGVIKGSHTGKCDWHMMARLGAQQSGINSDNSDMTLTKVPSLRFQSHQTSKEGGALFYGSI